MPSRYFSILGLIVAMGLVGCNLPQMSEATESIPASATSSASSNEPTPVGTKAAVAPTATSGAVACLQSTGAVAPPTIDDPLDAGDTLVQYLNAGGSIEQLREIAQEPLVQNHFGNAEGLTELDLDGDGFQEVAISLIDLDDPFQRGKVYVAMCSMGEYSIVYTSDLSYPKVLIGTTNDLTGDGLADLMLVKESCGAHTCSSTLEIVGWSEEGLRNLMEQVELDLPTTGIELVSPSGNDPYAIYMTGNGIGSVGAGPYHPRGVLWEWDSSVQLFRPGEIMFLASDWRIHQVHDGDRAFAAGNYQDALDHYENVIENPSLRDWPGAGMDPELDNLRATELAAYARFRLVLANLKLEAFSAAETSLMDLLANHPAGDPGEGFASLGDAFWAEFSVSGDFDLACVAAQRAAEAMPVEDLAPLDYGYSNPTYTPADMCPTTQ